MTQNYVDQNVANAQLGAVATSSGAAPSQPAWTAIDGNRGTPYSAAIGQYLYWASTARVSRFCTAGVYWLRVDFSGSHHISEIDLYSLQDNYTDGYDPTASTITNTYGSTDLHLSYCPSGVTCGTGLANGWVDVTGGHVTGNNKAIVTRTFNPVTASAIRVGIDCTQTAYSYITEVEAWEHVGPNTCTVEPPRLYEPPSITGNSPAQIIHDSDVFWGSPNGFMDMDEPAEKAFIHQSFHDAHPSGALADVWSIGRQALAAAQMYDRLAPIDTCRANHYLEYLRVQAEELLLWRDDKIGNPQDAFRHRVMAGWGGFAADLDGNWNTDVVVAGLLTYPMAAFAKRVSANPSAFSVGYQKDAIRFTTAVMETYVSYRPELHFSTADPWAYHITSPGYSTLTCSDLSEPNHHNCTNHKADASHPEGWNEDLIFMRTLAEAASAADSTLYRTSSDPWKPTTISYLAVEAPDVVAKYVRFFNDYLNSGGRLRFWSGDNAAYYVWNKKYDTAGGTQIENTPHAQISLAALVTIYENTGALNSLLYAAGFTETVNLTPQILERFAVTFLRLIWNSDNFIGDWVDGGLDGTAAQNWNIEVGGFIGLSQIDPWVWVRAHDSLFNVWVYPNALREDNYAALIRYQ